MTEPLRTLTVDVDGGIHARTVKGSTLQHFYAEIGCHTVDCVGLAADLDMWLDDEGLLVEEPRINHGATAIAAMYGKTFQPYVGTVVFTGGVDDEGNTLGLDALQIKALRRAAVLGYTRAIARQVMFVGDRKGC